MEWRLPDHLREQFRERNDANLQQAIILENTLTSVNGRDVNVALRLGEHVDILLPVIGKNDDDDDEIIAGSNTTIITAPPHGHEGPVCVRRFGQ